MLILRIFFLICPNALPHSMQQRALATGRVVPRDLLEAVLEQVPQSVQILGK